MTERRLPSGSSGSISRSSGRSRIARCSRVPPPAPPEKIPARLVSLPLSLTWAWVRAPGEPSTLPSRREPFRNVIVQEI